MHLKPSYDRVRSKGRKTRLVKKKMHDAKQVTDTDADRMLEVYDLRVFL